MQRFEKLEILEEKISNTITRYTELSERCGDLKSQNSTLETEVETLRRQNTELAQKIVELKTAQEGMTERAFEEKEVLNKIDRMLEKFGELQI